MASGGGRRHFLGVSWVAGATREGAGGGHAGNCSKPLHRLERCCSFCCHTKGAGRRWRGGPGRRE
eukprot:15479331-Alexandrium_andersonii.AAC.1